LADTTTTVRTSVDLELDRSAAFDVIVKEVAAALADAGIQLKPGAGGCIVQDGVEVGRVLSWEPGQRVLLEWRPADWDQKLTEVELRFEPASQRTKITLEHRGWGPLIGGPDEVAGWFAGQVAAPLLRAMTPRGLGDWVTDRKARRPSGERARAFYRDPLFHYPMFRVILGELALGPDDYLLEVGCGGGAFLKDALQSGCRAAAVDHSPDMVQVAREANREAIAEGRLEVVESKADHLPFPDATFSCAAMSDVLGFLPDPVVTFAEIRRVLRSRGRFVGLGSDPELKGTPAAPEPMASRLHFYTERELEGLARNAGFEDVQVVRRPLYDFAREAGIPEDALSLFAGPGASFLLARKTAAVQPRP
jgi:SAM-dependent methyltransferase